MIIEWHDRFDAGDLAWMAVGIAAVFVLLPGLLLFYGGSRDWQRGAEPAAGWLGLIAVVSVAWCLWIYSLAFGPSWGTVPEVDSDAPSPVATDFQSMMETSHEVEDTTDEQGRGGVIGGTQYAGLRNIGPRAGYPRSLYATRRPAYHLPHALFVVFHLAVFVAYLAPLLLVLIERVAWAGAAAFAVLWGTLVYAPLVHWVWGEGWLGALGALDSSGGLLHVGLGCSALIASLVLGRPEWTESAAPADNPVGLLQRSGSVAGAAAVWAALLLTHGALILKADGRAAGAMLNSQLAAAAGLLAWYIAARFLGAQAGRNVPHAGAIAGLAAIAPGCGLVMPHSALIIGVVGGVCGALTFSGLGDRSSRHAGFAVFAVQGIPAAVGIVLAGVFASSAAAGIDRHGEAVEGVVAGNLERLASQGMALGAAVLLAAVGTLAIAVLVRFCARSRA